MFQMRKDLKRRYILMQYITIIIHMADLMLTNVKEINRSHFLSKVNSLNSR